VLWTAINSKGAKVFSTWRDFTLTGAAAAFPSQSDNKVSTSIYPSSNGRPVALSEL